MDNCKSYCYRIYMWVWICIAVRVGYGVVEVDSLNGEHVVIFIRGGL
jgi:hypothetical protein